MECLADIWSSHACKHSRVLVENKRGNDWHTQQWLLRQQELSAEASQSQVRLQDAQQALEQAQPQLATLLNAQPATG